MSRKEEVYIPALKGKRIPILTLDNKWHKLFTQMGTTPEIEELAQKLNFLLKKQGKCNTDIKSIKALKKKLLDEVVVLADELEEKLSDPVKKKKEKEIAEHKRLIEECSEKIDGYKDDLLELPKKINQLNEQLMLETMVLCYDRIKANTEEIDSISTWINEIRVKLKKEVIRKQKSEIRNNELYHYMHDIFGADVINIFDMKYNPEKLRKEKELQKEIKKEKKDEVSSKEM